MSYLKEFRKRRDEMRKEMRKQVKAAKAKAREEAKQAGKLARQEKKEAAKVAKRERKHEQKLEIKAAQAEKKQVAKQDAKARKLDGKALKRAEKIRKSQFKDEKKALAAKQKYQMRMAQKVLDQQRAQGFSKEKAKSWVGGGRVLIPVLAPLAYRAITALQNREQEASAKRFGVSADAVARHHGYGAPLRARVEATRTSLKELNRNSNAAPGFVKDANKRLDIIDDALDTAENMTPDQRRRAFQSIISELNGLDSQILDQLGV